MAESERQFVQVYNDAVRGGGVNDVAVPKGITIVPRVRRVSYVNADDVNCYINPDKTSNFKEGGNATNKSRKIKLNLEDNGEGQK